MQALMELCASMQLNQLIICDRRLITWNMLARSMSSREYEAGISYVVNEK